MLYSSLAETVLASSTLNPIPPFASISQKESVTEFHSRDLNWNTAEGKKERMKKLNPAPCGRQASMPAMSSSPINPALVSRKQNLNCAHDEMRREGVWWIQCGREG